MSITKGHLPTSTELKGDDLVTREYYVGIIPFNTKIFRKEVQRRQKPDTGYGKAGTAGEGTEELAACKAPSCWQDMEPTGPARWRDLSKYTCTAKTLAFKSQDWPAHRGQIGICVSSFFLLHVRI